jgi:hypothetical protein
MDLAKNITAYQENHRNLSLATPGIKSWFWFSAWAVHAMVALLRLVLP